MSKTLQFIIMVTPMRSRMRLVDTLCQSLPEASRVKPHSFDLAGNWFELWENPSADVDQAMDPDEGYLFYDGRLEATPTRPGIEEEAQVALAARVVLALHEQGLRSVVCANFEERVEVLVESLTERAMQGGSDPETR